MKMEQNDREQNLRQPERPWKLIALDLDGTTLRSDKGLSERTRKVLGACADRGIHLVIASGRAFASLPREVLELPGVEYAITSNGAAIYQVKGEERLFHFPMEEEKTVQVLELIRKYTLTFEIFIDGVPYAMEDYVRDPASYGATEQGVIYVKRTRRPVADLEHFAWEHRDCLDCLDLVIREPRMKEMMAEELQKIGGLYVTSSISHLLEIANQAAGKGAALQTLGAYLKVPRSCMAAFGNEENDLDMMAFAGLGVAVANSPAHVRAAADAVTGTNDEDGVAVYLEKLLRL